MIVAIDYLYVVLFTFVQGLLIISNRLLVDTLFTRKAGSENGFFLDLRGLENCMSPDFADSLTVNYTYQTPLAGSSQAVYRQVLSYYQIPG